MIHFLKFFSRIYNRLFSKEKVFIKRLRGLIGFTPANLGIFKLAFYHKSTTSDKLYAIQSNERLEYLGDAVLATIVAEYLFQKYPNSDEGFLTKMRSKIVKRYSLNVIADKMGLDVFLNQYNNTRLSRSMLGNALEALVGAVYLEKGYNQTRKFVINRILLGYLDIHELESFDDNYKSQLLEWCQKNGKTVSYKMVSKYKFEKRDRFKVAVLIDSEKLAVADDFNKKSAEQTASERAMQILGILGNKDDNKEIKGKNGPRSKQGASRQRKNENRDRKKPDSRNKPKKERNTENKKTAKASKEKNNEPRKNTNKDKNTSSRRNAGDGSKNEPRKKQERKSDSKEKNPIEATAKSEPTSRREPSSKSVSRSRPKSTSKSVEPKENPIVAASKLAEPITRGKSRSKQNSRTEKTKENSAKSEPTTRRDPDSKSKQEQRTEMREKSESANRNPRRKPEPKPEAKENGRESLATSEAPNKMEPTNRNPRRKQEPKSEVKENIVEPIAKAEPTSKPESIARPENGAKPANRNPRRSANRSRSNRAQERTQNEQNRKPEDNKKTPETFDSNPSEILP